MRFALKELVASSASHPAWHAEVMRVGMVSGNGRYLDVPDGHEVLAKRPRKLVAKRTEATKATKVTPEVLPEWGRALMEQALPGEAGLGDVVARVVGPFGSDAFKVWYAETVGVFAATCNCQGWKAEWNQRWPV